MSIYRDRRRTQQNITLEFADVAHDSVPVDTMSAAAVALLRKASPANVLLHATIVWLQMLPTAVRPLELCERFPRIANQLSSAWRDPVAARACFGRLLLDSRIGRQGFPEGILDELLVLQAHYEFESPPGKDTWEGS
jgi:hypothetical protein